MTWFTASSVSVNNGQLVVNVNAGDDIQLAQAAGGLIIGNNPPVEIKRTYRDGNNLPKIELRSPWPYANQAAQPAVAFPTDGDLAAATAVLKQLIDGFAIATQAQAQQGTDNTFTMTALRVKQAIDFFRPLTVSQADTTLGRVLKVGDFGIGGLLPVFTGNIDTITFKSSFALIPTTSGTLPQGFSSFDGFILETGVWIGTEIRFQKLTRFGFVFIRNMEADVWQPWCQIYHNRNIVGQVNQSGGVPTGAIIERGANANGEYTKFADGTMICTARLYTEHGTRITTTTFNWVFPVSFAAGETIVSGSFWCIDAGVDFRSGVLTQSNNSSGSTAAQFAGFDFNKQTFNISLFVLTAIGRWY